jgi:flavin-dependent trigonelline monooxygenase, reductase component
MKAGVENAFDVKEFRRALGCFVTGVTVVTTVDPNSGPKGFTANSFTSVSLDPPLVLVCIAKTSGSHDAFLHSSAFAINILQESQRDISTCFARKGSDKFSDVQFATGATGSPILPESAAWIDCETHDRIDAGDHTILIGRAVDLMHTPRTPLGFYSGNYIDFGVERRTVERLASNGQLVIGGIFERDGEVLMVERAEGLFLPEATSLGRVDQQSDSLLGEVARLGLRVGISFVYAVFEDQASGALHVFFRGEVLESKHHSEAVRFVPFDALDRAPIARLTTRHMLRRFARESAESGFGVYVGNSTKGIVRTVVGPEMRPHE